MSETVNRPLGLRNHIPIPGPATREPEIGDEPYVRLSLGFHPRWYVERFDVTFDERWHTDPVYRFKTLEKIKNDLHKKFPDIDNFDPYTRETGINTCATVSGVHGVMVIPLLYGMGVKYIADQFPDSKDGVFRTKVELSKLKPIRIVEHPMVEQLVSQMEVIKREWGLVHGYLNYQGILNVAFKVRGPEILVDMVDDPVFAEDFFSHIADTILNFARFIQGYQRSGGFDIDLLSLSNCVINLISPEMYGKFILPHDIHMSRYFSRFGIHTCNWNVTPYIEELLKINNLGYLDMGENSDLPLIRQKFPFTRRAVLLDPNLMRDTETLSLKKVVEKIAAEFAPCDVAMGSIDTSVSIERIQDFIRMVHCCNDQKEGSK
jgi:hypothetical protein